MLVKNETQVMRVQSQKVMMWQPSPSRAKLHQASYSFQTSPSAHASWQKKAKRRQIQKLPPSPKYFTSDKDIFSSDNYDSSDDDKPFLSELVKNPNAMIKCLMRRVEARDELLE
jgi:hypothetical protein